MFSGVIIQGIDAIDMAKTVIRKGRKFQAIALSKVEAVVPKDSDLYKQLRKIILDVVNEFTREVIREIFGDIDVGY